jgi:hypothetical protein
MAWTARDEWERAKAVKERHADELMGYPNVVGVGVGWLRDELGGGPIIRLYVREYQRWEGPRFLEGVPVHPELVGDVVAQGARLAAGPGAGDGEADSDG